MNSDNDIPGGDGRSSQSLGPSAGFNEYFNSAMRGALIVSVGFLLQGLALVTFRWGLVSSLLYFLGLLAVPVLLYVVGRNYFREKVTGPVPYLTAASFLFWTLLLSLIVAALIYYGAFYFLLNNPVFGEMLDQSMTQLESFISDRAVLEQMEASYAGLTAKSMTLSTCGTFFFFGTVYVYLIALFFRRS